MHRSDPYFAAQIQKGWDTFDKYYSLSDESPLYAAAIILHPVRRTQYIAHNWRKEWQKPAFESVKKLWRDYRRALADINTITASLQETELSKVLDSYDQYAENLNRYAGPSTQDEYSEYIAEMPTSPEDCKSPLSWWLHDAIRKRWPTLSKMAIDILSIPAMSAEPERVFSGARRTISWERMQFGEANICKVECLKSWLRSGLTVNKDE
jgi:hAT family C-terminal dimerisation region